MRIVWGTREELPKTSFDALLHYRYRVFVEHLGWPLGTNGQRESDQFDGPSAIYGIAFDDCGTVKGCARLLPTTRPYLLAKVFPELLHGEAAPSSDRIWEVSRFASMDLEARGRGPLRQFSDEGTLEIVGATLQRVAGLGVEQLVSVSTVGLERLLRKMGVEVRSRCPKRTSSSLVACWIEVARSRRAVNAAPSRRRSAPAARACVVEPPRAFELV